MPKRKRNETAAAGQQPLRRSARLIEKRQNELAQAHAQAQAQAQAQQNNNQGANNQVPQQPQKQQQPQQQPQQQKPQQQAQGQVQQQVQQQPQPQQQQLPLNPPPQAVPGPQLPQDVQIRLQDKIKRANNSPGIQHWMAHNRWPQRPAAERFGQVDPQLLPLLKRSRGSVQARAAADADWEVEEERARSPERDEADYTVANCTAILKKYRILTRDRRAGVPTKVRILCADLRAKDVELPKDTVFELEPFLMTCERLLTKNNNGVNRLIGELLVPSAETAIDRGLTEFQHYAVGMSEIWTLMSPLMDDGQERLPIPQPDYAVGFSEEAFAEEQLEKLQPYSGPESFFRPTPTMNFPFLTTEIKARQLLDMADVENTYSAALAVGGVVALFTIVGREEELHKEVLAFSISHSHRIVRIYAHYVMFDNGAVSYYRHLVHEYTLTPRDIRQRWASYKFVMAVYNEWAPVHHARICSAIDNLPDPAEQDGSESGPESATESSEE